jgi:hypothetical protein
MTIACIKLISGEELIAEVQQGSNPLDIIVHNPVVVHKQQTAMGPMMTVSHWLMFTKENKATINRKNIVALEVDLEENAIQHYMKFINNKGELNHLDNQEKLDELLHKLDELTGENVIETDNMNEPESNTTIH